MTEKSRYDWIKLRTDYFGREEIDYLLSQDNGSEYVIVYQMLCLKAANTEGVLAAKIGSVEVPVTIDKIARDSKYYSVQTINAAITLFKNIGLISEREDGVMIINRMQEMVGSESGGKSAERMRKMRSKRKQEKNNTEESDVTSVTKCDIDRRDREIDNREIDNREEDFRYSDIRDTEIDNREEEIRYSDIRDTEIDNRKEEIRYSDIRDTEIENAEINNLSEQELNEYRAVQKAFNSICLSLTPVSTITKKRIEKLRLIRKRYGNYFNYEEFFKRVENSDFLTGRNGSWYSGKEKRANFDWILKCENIEKIESGKYDNSQNKYQSSCKIPGSLSSFTPETYEFLEKIGTNL